jgi:hypothetical protein
MALDRELWRLKNYEKFPEKREQLLLKKLNEFLDFD